MNVYERVMELIEDAKVHLMDYELFLEKLSLLMAEEMDDMKDELEVIKEKVERYD
jgi:hypothetical protein